jgi:hypothetical protein
MSKRRLFIFIGLAMALTAMVGHQAWRLLQMGDRLKYVVKTQLEAAFGQNTRFDGVKLGLGVVHLRHVHFNLAQSPFQLSVDELSVEFNALDLLTNGLKPERTARKIILTRPRLSIYRGAPRKETKLAVKLDLSRVPNNQLASLQPATPRDYSFIDNVTISNGEVVLFDSLSGASSLIAEGVSGWLESQGEGRAVAKMAGHLFSSEAFDLDVEAGINFRHGTLNYAQVTLREHQLNHDLPMLLPANVKILDGRLSGNLRITATAAAAAGRKYDMAGRFYLRQGRAAADDGRLTFDDINMDVNISDWSMRIIKASQFCNGSRITFKGSIDNLANPRFNVEVASDSLSLFHALKLFHPTTNLKADGLFALRASVRDSLPNLSIAGELSSDEARLDGAQMEEITARFAYKDSVLKIDHLAAKMDNVLCKGIGAIRVRDPGAPMDFDLVVSGDLAPVIKSVLMLPLAENSGELFVHAGGPLADPQLTGRFEVVPINQRVSNAAVLGHFSFADRRLQVEAVTSQGDSILSLTLNRALEQRSLKFHGRSMERGLYLLNDARVAEQTQKFRIDASAEGSLDSLNVMLSVTDRARARPLVQLVSSLSEASGSYLSSGYVRVFPGAYNEFTIDYQGMYRDSTLHLLNIESKTRSTEMTPWLNGALQLAFGGDRRVRGNLKISGMDLARLVEGIERQTPKYAGRFFADCKLGGTWRSPTLGGSLWLVDGFIHGVGRLALEAEIKLDRSGVHLAPLTVQKDGVQFFRAAGDYDFSSRRVDLHASAKNVDAAQFLKAVAGVEDVLSGHASFDVHLSGAGPRVPVYGTIELNKGTLMWFSYDRVLLDFGEANGKGSNAYVSNAGLHAPKVYYEKDGAYRLQGGVVLPWTNDDSLRLALAGDGNFLDVVREFTDFFEQPRSNGHLALQMSGTYQDLTLHDTSLQFTDGFMRLGNIAHAVTDMSGDFFIDSRGEFVDVQQLRGQIGDATVSISNQEAPVDSRQSLHIPFRLFDSDLSLGTLIINSSPSGFLLHIPGLMEPGEMGRFAVGGRDGGKGFFVAGPWAHPKFRGQLELEGVNFMFPFDASSEPPDSLLTQILWNLDYDVRVISRKDNRYVQKVPSPVDNVYVNLGIDDNASALEFSGILSDSSFRTQGHAESTRGNIEYLDLNFRVEKFSIDFNKNDLWPAINGRAWTVFTDSTNFPQNIYLTPHTRNRITGEEQSGGRWDEVYFKLSSDNPNYGESQAQILAALGYSVETARAWATEAVGTATDNRLLRPLFRPVERQLKRHLGLDIVRLSSRLTRNFIEYNLSSTPNFESRLALWRDTRLTLGKYLSDDLYFLYNGQIEAGIDTRYQDRGYGLRHIVGLEYRLNPTLLLQMEYDYNTLLLRDKIDRKVWFRHSFAF